MASNIKHLRRPAADSADRRERILDIAEARFAVEGFAATSMRDIAQAARVNVATVYYHCGSKDQLFGAIYARVVERMATVVGERFETGGPFLDVVSSVLDEVVKYFAENPLIPRLLLRYSLDAEGGTTQLTRDTYQSVFDFAEAELKRRAGEGEINDVDPATFVRAASAVIFYLAMQLGGEDADLDKIQRHARYFVLGALGIRDGVAMGAEN